MRALTLEALCVIAASVAFVGTALSQASFDAVVVLGHRPALEDGRIEAELAARVAHGVERFRLVASPLLVLAGGPGEGYVEAEVMALHASSLGVAQGSMLLETASRDTIENARFSVALLRTKLGLERPRILLVTSGYHMARAARLFRCAGAEVEEAPVRAPSSRAARASRRLREWLVALSYVFIDECARARGIGR